MKKRTLALIIAGVLATGVAVVGRNEISYQMYNARKVIELTLPRLIPEKDYVVLRKNPVVMGVFYREKDGIASAKLTDLATGEETDVTEHLEDAEILSGGDHMTHFNYLSPDNPEGLDRGNDYSLRIVDKNGNTTESRTESD